MKSQKKNILILSIAYLPNTGGVETHLKDLTEVLKKSGWLTTVLTYQPLQNPTRGKWIEKEKKLTIYRLPVIRGLFYKLLDKPLLEFLFLGTLQFFVTPIILLSNPDIQIINAQGIISGFSAAIWSRLFKKRLVIATQSVYVFPKSGLYRRVVSWIFKSSDKILAISDQSALEVEDLGIPAKKIQVFTHWEDTNKFKPVEKKKAKAKLSLTNKFVVSFFGRLVKEKGVEVILKLPKKLLPHINLLVYGVGPLEQAVKLAANARQLNYMGIVDPADLPWHYSAADLVIMPTLSEEGFGRIAAGAMLCGTPMIVSNKGALPEVVGPEVGVVVDPKPEDFAASINYLFKNPAKLKKLAQNCRKYALKRFSAKNARIILKTFEG